jgi:hypothetical protein
MNDIVSSLRHIQEYGQASCHLDDAGRAADLIEKLRAALELADHLLDKLGCYSDSGHPYFAARAAVESSN